MKKTNPISTKELREIAYRFRKQYNIDNILCFPILNILDDLAENELLDFVVIEDDNNQMGTDTVAYYDYNENMIYMKECVYIEALDGIGRSIFTITHELAHYILFKVLNFEIVETDEKVITYCDPEWQANMLAGELLVPYNETIDMSVDELVKYCNISEECAIVTYQKRHKKKTFDK